MALAPIKQRYSDLVAFFQWWVPNYLPNANLYLQGQNAPRPENPYISFNPIEDIDIVGIDERRIESSTEEFLRGQRIITCSLEAYSDSETRFDGNDNAWEMMQELRFSLGYPEVHDKLSAINCRILDEGTVNNTSLTINTTNEPRAGLSFTLSTVILQPIDSGAIETANASGTIGNQKADISVTKP